MRIQIKKDRLIEIMLIIYASFGMMLEYNILKYLGYSISLTLQIMTFMKTLYMRKCEIKNSDFIRMYISYALTLIIMIQFLYLGCSIVNILNRILPLLSIFGLQIILLNEHKLDWEFLIRGILDVYALIGIIVCLDFAQYYMLGKAFWYPIQYVSKRFYGPFGDPNFMAVAYLFVLVLLNNTQFFSKKRRAGYYLIYIFLIYISGSWSIYCFLGVILLLKKLNVYFHRICFKQVIGFTLYIAIIYIMYSFRTQIEEVFLKMLLIVTNVSEVSLNAKFASLYIRIDTQIEALNLFGKQIMGYGPRTIVQYLGHDTHNSFIGFAFELGIAGLILLFINAKKNTLFNSRLIDQLHWVIFLSSFMLNIHYQSLYGFFLLVMFDLSQEGRLTLNSSFVTHYHISKKII